MDWSVTCRQLDTDAGLQVLILLEQRLLLLLKPSQCVLVILCFVSYDYFLNETVQRFRT